MGILVGDFTFEDYGNAPEVYIQNNAIPAWERLSGDLARLFICKEIGERRVLDHTDLITRSTMIAIGKRFLEIAEEMSEMDRDKSSLWPKTTLNAGLC